jgi:hypothetical protein
MPTEHTSLAGTMSANVIANEALGDGFKAPYFTIDSVCYGADGKEKWRESVRNLVTTEGKNDLIDKYFKGSAYTAGWYLGLKGTGSPVVGDTLASHGGWSEITPYSGNRPAITFGTTSAGSNTATQVSITINATATVYGAIITSVNSGTSGKLYSATDFSASRSVVSGDTINVIVTVSAS